MKILPKIQVSPKTDSGRAFYTRAWETYARGTFFLACVPVLRALLYAKKVTSTHHVFNECCTGQALFVRMIEGRLLLNVVWQNRAQTTSRRKK